MVAVCVATVVIEHPSSVVHQANPAPLARRAAIGLSMGLTAIGLIYSPWGQRSGAHMNPAVTMTFFRLGKIRRTDAIFYVLSQFTGALCGVLLAIHFLPSRLALSEVHFAVTRPGQFGPWIAASCEFLISFFLMMMVLQVSTRPALSRYTGVFAGILVAVFIALESPFSGMSMNPARSFSTALPADMWNSFWVYLLVPPLAMLAAAEVYLRTSSAGRLKCCKLYHNPQRSCIFCGSNGDHHEQRKSLWRQSTYLLVGSYQQLASYLLTFPLEFWSIWRRRMSYHR